MVQTAVVLGRLVAGAAGLGLIGLGFGVWRRHDRSTSDTFGGLLAVIGIAALCSAILPHQTIVYKLIWLYAFLGIPIAFARFSFDYYGLKLGWRRFLWAAVPPVLGALAGTVLLLVGPSMGPVEGVDAVLPAGALDLAFAVRDIGMYYSSGLMVVALGLVIRNVLQYQHLEVGLGIALAFVGGWSWIAYVISPELVAIVGRSGSLLAIAGCYVLSLGAGLLAYRRYGVLETAPAVSNAAPERVLDSIEDAVVVIGEDRQILRVNAAAAEQFGVTEQTAVGGDLEDVIGIEPSQLASGTPVELPTVAGPRRFELRTSAIIDRTGNREGQAIVCRDVTRRETREQRLEVLNRVMRHNLRNDLSKILGHAELIADGGHSEAVSHASTIKGTAEELASIGDRAREVDQLMSVPGRLDEPMDVSEAITAIAAEFDEKYPEIDVSMAVGNDLKSEVNPRILRIVLRNVVDNACEHNDADQPLVVVSAEADESGDIAVAIADNGPGLPEHERQPLRAGGEDPLKHGSGLGLWTAKWGVTRMGGALSFSDNQPRGTIVRVDIPGFRRTSE